MKKDFSQPFEHSPFARVDLLIEVKDKFLYYHYKDELDSDFYNILSLKLDQREGFGIQLARFLFEEGFVLNSYRELQWQSGVVFSFADETPGAEWDEAAFYVSVDLVNEAAGEKHGKMLFGTLEELDYNFGPPPKSPVGLGIRQLLLERALINDN